jgi:hypothetical protein
MISTGTGLHAHVAVATAVGGLQAPTISARDLGSHMRVEIAISSRRRPRGHPGHAAGYGRGSTCPIRLSQPHAVLARPAGVRGGDNQTSNTCVGPRRARVGTSRRRRSWVHCEHGAICLLPAGVVAAAREPHACWSRESPEAQDQEALSDNGLPLPRRAKQHGQSQPVASMPRPSRWACRRSVGACRRACAV